MDDNFGPTCRYKGTERKILRTPEDLAAAEKDGWVDTPPAAKKTAKKDK